MAFQPIVNTSNNTVFAYESLVRGKDGAGAKSILDKVNEANRYRFDQACRVKAVELAAKPGLKIFKHQFLPNAVYQAEACIRTTLQAAERFGFPIDRIIFEVTEGESITDKAHIKKVMSAYKKQGFKTAIDDFGAGYSGLNLLADFQPDIIKIDMDLIRGIQHSKAKRVITHGIVTIAKALGSEVIAEGVETSEELTTLQDIGVDLFQGYFSQNQRSRPSPVFGLSRDIDDTEAPSP